MNLGKMLFPNYPSSRRTKEIKQLGLITLVAIMLCLIISGVLYMLNIQGRL